MLQEIKFRHNKHSQYTLYLSLIMFVFIGLLGCCFILELIGITKENAQEVPLYFREHPNHAVLAIFAAIIFSMSLSALIPYLWWRSKDEEAILRLWEDYAILFYKGEEIKIEKGTLKIDVFIARGSNLYSYRLQIPGRKILLNPSRIEQKKRTGVKFSSLEVAMDSLFYYDGKSEISKQLETTFYDLKLTLNVTSAEIFDDSPYFVDFENMTAIREEGYASCLIKEKANPEHIVGDLLIDIRNLPDQELKLEILKNRPIIAILELDEHDKRMNE